MTLAGRRVLITGGGTGVGAGLAHGFAAAGAEVVITGRRLAPAEAAAAALWLCRTGSEDVNGRAIATSGGEA